MPPQCRRALGWIAFAWVVAGLWPGLARPAVAQILWSRGQWHAEGSFFLDWEDQNDMRSQLRYNTILFQERLGLHGVGAWVIDPRVISMNLGGSFGLSNEDGINVTDTPLRVGNGTLYDYALDTFILSESAYPVTVFANRVENLLNQGFGTQSDDTFESHGAILELRENSILEDWGWLGFTSLLDVHQERNRENSLTFGSPFNIDEHRNVVRYRAHKGGEFSDFDLRYELNDVADPLNPINTFNAHTLRAQHSLDFGPTLNRRVDSNFYYFTRTGSTPGDYVSLDELLRLDHNADFWSDYRYGFSRSNTTSGTTMTNAAVLEVNHRLFQRLTSTFSAGAARQDYSVGDKTSYGARGGAYYRRPLGWNGELFVDVFGGYQIDDNHFTASTIDVVDEPHVAPPVFGSGQGFELDNNFVQTDTIVVVDVRGGSMLPTQVNIDYVIVPQGSLTEIVPLPTSPVIRPGDPLLVSYSYTVDPSLKYSTATLNARLGVDFPWGTASYVHYLSNQNALGGTSAPDILIDENSDVFKVDLRGQWDGLRAQSTIAYGILHSTLIDSRGWQLNQVLSYQMGPDLLAQLGGDEALVDYPGQNRNSQSYLVRANLDWFTPLGLNLSPFTGYRSYQDSAVPSDQIFDIGVLARWVYRDLEVTPSIAWTDYRGRLSSVQAQLRIVRHLF